DPPVSIARLGAGLGRAGVRARLGLSEAERPQLLAGEQVGQPALLLLGAAEIVDGRSAKANGGFERDANPRVRSRDLLDRNAQRQEICPRAAVLRRERQPEEAQLAHAADDVVAEPVVAVE